MTTQQDEKPKKNRGGAPKGNQNAVGHGCGRPRKYDYAAEGKELYEWSKLPNSTAIYQFTRDNNKDYLADELDEFADRDVDFALYYKRAKENIGQNREDMCNLGTVNYGVWARSATRYHAGLHKFERAEKAYEIELKTKAEHASLPSLDAIVERDNENMALKAQLAKMQEQLDNLTKARQKLPGSDT